MAIIQATGGSLLVGGKLIEGVGLGTPLVGPGVPVNGTTFAGIAPLGAILINAANGARFVNTGTQAAPLWTAI